MDLFQCVLTPREDFEGGDYRQTRSADRDIVKRPRDFRGQSLPNYGHRYQAQQPPPVSRRVRIEEQNMRQRNPSTVSKGSNSIGSGLRHWGSSLSLASENSVNELTRRTLRPPSPTTLSRASTPSRYVPPESFAKPKTVPLTVQTNLNHPQLKDYLEKPRLVSTLGCGGVKPWSGYQSEHHARRLANNETPSYRNLRLGGFLEGPQNANNDEIIPEILRQYYYDTYLDTCDRAGSTKSGLVVNTLNRGM